MCYTGGATITAKNMGNGEREREREREKHYNRATVAAVQGRLTISLILFLLVHVSSASRRDTLTTTHNYGASKHTRNGKCTNRTKASYTRRCNQEVKGEDVLVSSLFPSSCSSSSSSTRIDASFCLCRGARNRRRYKGERNQTKGREDDLAKRQHCTHCWQIHFCHFRPLEMEAKAK